MIALPQRQELVADIEQACQDGVPLGLACAELGLSARTVERWRSEGRGPRYLKLSKRVGYPVDAILEFEREALHDSTSERAAV